MEDMASNNNIENVIISSSAKTSIKYKNFTDCLKSI